MPAFLKPALQAISFLTILPVGIRGQFKQHSYMSATFPLVGLLIGSILALAAALLASFNAPVVGAAILAVIWIVMTGGLHLDGLADTADGLASGFDRDKIIKVMSDPANGTFAVISIAMTIILKVSILSTLAGAQILALLVAPVIARWTIVLTLFFSKYPEKDGIAKTFFIETKSLSFFIATATMLIISFILLPYATASAMVLTAFFLTIFAGKYFELRIGGNTGDTLGAIVEINEIIVLLLFLAVL